MKRITPQSTPGSYMCVTVRQLLVSVLYQRWVKMSKRVRAKKQDRSSCSTGATQQCRCIGLHQLLHWKVLLFIACENRLYRTAAPTAAQSSSFEMGWIIWGCGARVPVPLYDIQNGWGDSAPPRPKLSRFLLKKLSNTSMLRLVPVGAAHTRLPLPVMIFFPQF